MAAEITIKGSTIDVGQIRPVFRGLINQRRYLFDTSKDSSRVLVNVLSGPSSREARSVPSRSPWSQTGALY
jgi:hypothetical protein